MNLFATVLTHIAPSANYRGESLENVAAMQKITIGRFDYPIISPEAMRNAIREVLRGYGAPCNRERLGDEEQLAVKFRDYPDAEQYADDFLMGWLVAQGSTERKATLEKLRKAGRTDGKFTFRRDSVLRMNLAVALEPFRHSTVFTQSPQHSDESPWKNADQSQLLHRETAVTAFQYPLAVNLDDCTTNQQRCWMELLLRAIGELNGVAGNHARSYFEMAPASIVVRLTKQLVAGYDTYGFEIRDPGTGGLGRGVHDFPEVVDGILHEPPDYCPKEFFVGGRIVKDMAQEKRDKLQSAGVTLNRNPQSLLDAVSKRLFSGREHEGKK